MTKREIERSQVWKWGGLTSWPVFQKKIQVPCKQAISFSFFSIFSCMTIKSSKQCSEGTPVHVLPLGIKARSPKVGGACPTCRVNVTQPSTPRPTCKSICRTSISYMYMYNNCMCTCRFICTRYMYTWVHVCASYSRKYSIGSKRIEPGPAPPVRLVRF